MGLCPWLGLKWFGKACGIVGVGSDGRCSITKTNNKQPSSMLTNWWLKVGEHKPASETGGQRGQKVPKLQISLCFIIAGVTGVTFITDHHWQTFFFLIDLFFNSKLFASCRKWQPLNMQRKPQNYNSEKSSSLSCWFTGFFSLNFLKTTSCFFMDLFSLKRGHCKVLSVIFLICLSVLPPIL